jgi:hypothetical protein
MYNSESDVVKTNFCQSCGRMTHSYEETDFSKKTGIAYVILGWFFFAVSLLFIPILFGAVAFCMGFLTYSVRSKTHGVILMFFAAMGLLLGSMFSFIVAGTMFI